MLDLDGRVSSWNLGAQIMKGYARDEIIGQPFSRFFTVEDRNAGLPDRLMSEALQVGRVEGEGWRIRKDGKRFWAVTSLQTLYSDVGEPMGFAKITRDMTREREARQALIESERRFRFLVEGVIDYALYMLDPNGIVTNWNAGAEKIKGYTAQEIVGQHFSLFYTAVDRATGTPLTALTVAAAEGRYESEGWRVRKDGSQFWANVVIDAIHDEARTLVGFAKITRDITDKKRAESALRKSQEQMAQAQKMEALGQLTGGVAHDFNNLLMIVSGQAQLIRRKIEDDPGLRRSLDAIITAADRGTELTRQLLSFARRQRLQTTVAPFAERMGGIRELVSTSLPATVVLEINTPDTLWSVEADQGELDLALLNLAVNARDAMPSGGLLTISAENVCLEEGSLSGLKGEFVAVTVSDTGTGIPPDILGRIFEPFFTTKEVNRGTGLGLSQVFGFAKQAGGDMTVTSELGVGTQFVIYLPRSAGDRTYSARKPVETQDGATEKHGDSVLLVEDNPEVAEVATAMLEQLGHRVQVVGSAAAALCILRDGEHPDLVFSDIVMAGDIDGVGLARLVAQQYPELPVLLATGYSLAAEKLAGEFPIMRKPYSVNELDRALNALLAGRRMARTNVARTSRSGGGFEGGAPNA